MIKNKICKTSRKEAQKIKEKYSDNSSILIVELEGRNINSWADYITKIEKEFQFPTSCIDSIDRYNDWMTDLGWLKSSEYVLFIYNFSIFLNRNDYLKHTIINGFKDHILPFWESEVESCVVGGEAKSFNLYLVN